jgi:hypothetical protein
LKTLSTEQLMYLGGKYDVIQIMEGLKLLAEELQDYAWYLFLIGRLPGAEQLPDSGRPDAALPS